jgi:threonine/homoserine/homoserine lactone efflux protein
VWAELAPFLAASVAMELTPGPNMLYLGLLSAQNGRVAGLAAAAGVALGLLTIGLLALLGLGALVVGFPGVYAALHWAGVAYLVWLAWDTWKEARQPADHGPGVTLVQAFTRGLVTNLLNPKAFLFYLTVLPGFVGEGADFITHAIFLTLIYVGVASCVHASVIVGAGSLTRLLDQPGRRLTIGVIFALMLLAIAAWLAFKAAA